MTLPSAKPLEYLLTTLEACEFVLDFYVFHRRKFWKQTQLLKQMTDVALAYLYPVGYLLSGRIILIKHHAAAIIVTIANHITAKGTLAFSTVGLYKIKMSLFERDILTPYL